MGLFWFSYSKFLLTHSLLHKVDYYICFDILEEKFPSQFQLRLQINSSFHPLINYYFYHFRPEKEIS